MCRDEAELAVQLHGRPLLLLDHRQSCRLIGEFGLQPLQLGDVAADTLSGDLAAVPVQRTGVDLQLAGGAVGTEDGRLEVGRPGGVHHAASEVFDGGGHGVGCEHSCHVFPHQILRAPSEHVLTGGVDVDEASAQVDRVDDIGDHVDQCRVVELEVISAGTHACEPTARQIPRRPEQHIDPYGHPMDGGPSDRQSG